MCNNSVLLSSCPWSLRNGTVKGNAMKCYQICTYEKELTATQACPQYSTVINYQSINYLFMLSHISMLE